MVSGVGGVYKAEELIPAVEVVNILVRDVEKTVEEDGKHGSVVLDWFKQRRSRDAGERRYCTHPSVVGSMWRREIKLRTFGFVIVSESYLFAYLRSHILFFLITDLSTLQRFVSFFVLVII